MGKPPRALPNPARPGQTRICKPLRAFPDPDRPGQTRLANRLEHSHTQSDMGKTCMQTAQSIARPGYNLHDLACKPSRALADPARPGLQTAQCMGQTQL